jgi:hypothetical protein
MFSWDRKNKRGQEPFISNNLAHRIVKKFKLESILRERERPKKGG